MNLISTMIAVGLMSLGAATTAYYVSAPPMALSRLNAQAEADAVVEGLRISSRQGKNVTLTTQNGKLVGAVDGTPISLPSQCSFLNTFNNQSGIFVKCLGTGASSDSRADISRASVSALVGGDPCNSDLFPLPSTAPATPGQLYLCQESQNPPPSPTPGPLQNGHFDLDSYSGFRAKGLHVHAWDDKYGFGQFDIMNTSESLSCGSGSLPACGPFGVPKSTPEVIPTGQTFYLLVSNAKLSPMMMVTFSYTDSNNTPTTAKCTEDATISGARTFDRCFVSNPTSDTPTPLKFTTASGTPATGIVRLNSLVVGFSQANPHTLAGLIPTSTGMVNGTSSMPGKQKEYRNGAFVIQAVSSLPSTLYRLSAPANATLATLTGTSYSTDPYGTSCSSASARCYTSNGGTGLAASNVIYELTLFWHASGAVYNASSPYVPGSKTTVASYL